MKAQIEKLLKEKIGTSFVQEDTKGFNVFKLMGYGRGILIIYDYDLNGVMHTRIIYPTLEVFATDIRQGQEHFNEFFVATVKMMIEFRKKFEKQIINKERIT
jgi:hypothetical protein